MAIGFVDPSTLFCVCSQILSVDALGGKDSEVGGVGVKAGAVFADVGIRTGPLRGCAQAVAAGQAGFDGRGVFPAGGGDIGQRQPDCGGGGQRSDVAFGQVQGAFVFGAYGVVEQVRVAQAHLRGDVAQQRHEGLQ